MKRQSKPTVGPVEFIDRVIRLDEKGEPWTLAPYQRRILEMALRRDPSGELVFRLVVLSEPKKSSKTFMAACLCLRSGTLSFENAYCFRLVLRGKI